MKNNEFETYKHKEKKKKVSKEKENKLDINSIVKINIYNRDFQPAAALVQDD